MPQATATPVPRDAAVSNSGVREVTLYIGGVHGARDPTHIQTVLGSCISVCLWDPEMRVGGMNHFMLPEAGASSELDTGSDPNRFGVNAMDTLIGVLQRLGAERERLVAKCFGGGHVIDVGGSVASVARRNIEFTRDFLEEEGIPLRAHDLGGTHARQVRFLTATGRAYVRKIVTARVRQELTSRETGARRDKPRFGDIVLFGS